MNIIILVLVVIISIALLYLIFKRNLSESTLILQKTDLNTPEDTIFEASRIYKADSKQFTYSTWINIERTSTTDRVVLDRPSEMKIELKKDDPTLLVSLYLLGSPDDKNKHTIPIDKFPMKKKVFLTVCVTDKTVKTENGESTFSVVELYLNGKMIKSAKTASLVTPDLTTGLKIGTKASNDFIMRDNIQVQASSWATLYGLKRWAFCMLPKQVNDEYKSYAMFTNGYGANIALSEKDVVKKEYPLF